MNLPVLHAITRQETPTIMGEDRDDDSKHGQQDDSGKHGREDNTRDGRPDPVRPVPPPPDPNKHDR